MSCMIHNFDEHSGVRLNQDIIVHVNIMYKLLQKKIVRGIASLRECHFLRSPDRGMGCGPSAEEKHG